MKRLFEHIQYILHTALLRFDQDSSRAYNLFVHGYRLVYYTLRSRKLKRTHVESTALTLHTLFAVVPLLALLLIILRRMGAWEPVIESLYEGFSEWRTLIDKVIGIATSAADNIPNGIFAIIGISSLLWVIFIVFRSVENSFNHVWSVRTPRNIVKRYISYTLVAIIVPVLWGVATTFAHDAFKFIGLSHEMSHGVARIISIAITALATSLLYKYLPHAHVKWRYALIAGTLVGVVLMLWQWSYVYLQAYMTSYNAIYGSFAAIPLFIVWLQTSWNIILFGCELCCVWQNTARYERLDQRRLGFGLKRSDRELGVVVIGSGNVAEAFAMAISRCETMHLKQIFARNESRGRAIAERCHSVWCDRGDELAEADIYIIAVSDRAVGSVAQSLHFASDSVVVHTAGSVPITELPNKGVHRGILYAFQSFTAGRDIDFEGLPLFIEAESDEVYATLEEFGRLLQCRVEHATSERRRKIHLAGVFVNNFVNHMYGVAGDIVASEGLSFDVLRPLIEETAQKAIDSGNPRMVQTGPAVRGDRVVTERHMELLSDDELKTEIYKLITESIWETSKRT